MSEFYLDPEKVRAAMSDPAALEEMERAGTAANILRNRHAYGSGLEERSADEIAAAEAYYRERGIPIPPVQGFGEEA